MNTRTVGLIGAILFAASTAVFGQGFPDKPIRIVVPYPAGGGTDSIARLIGVHLGKKLNQQVVIDNKPGGNSVIAAQAVASSLPDGYAVLISDPTPLAINPSLFKKLPYEPVRDFEPVSMVARFPFVLLVNPASPINSVKDFIAAAKASPGKLNYGSAGTGTPVQLVMEMLKSSAGLEITHVPYKGAAPAVQDLMGGQIDAMFTDAASGSPFIKSGKVKALVVTGAKRTPALPDVPTMVEMGYPDFVLDAWFGIFAPRNTPTDVIAVLSNGLREVIADPQVNSSISALGFEPRTNKPAELAQVLKADTETWGKTVRALGISLD